MTTATSPQPAAERPDVAVPAAEAVPAPVRVPLWRRVLPDPYTFPGLVGALVFAVASFTPSLIPRPGLFQGVITGVTAAIGYGLGTVAAWAWRELADREERPTQQRSWRILLVAAVILLPIAVWVGQRFQGQLRDLMGVETPGSLWILTLPIAAAITFVLPIAIARALRKFAGWVGRVLSRFMGARAARFIGIVAVAALAISFASGVLFDGFIRAADSVFSVNNGITKPGSEEPTTGLRSGGPGSDITWESLGREGRAFIGLGPDAAQIEEVTGRDAIEPIRAYAGLETSDTTEARAQAAVDDLERAGGFDRSVLVVASTTGSGWLDPASVDSVEYLSGGDSAIVGIQYSYLPSWLSFLVDQQRAREAGRELFDAVFERWSALPQDERPQLFVFGESLGSFASETAFSGEFDLSNRTSGAVFAGPPNFNTLWREFTTNRDAGSPERLPVLRDGRIVRFTTEPKGVIEPADQPWDRSRTVYLQHASDPVVWWSPNLVFNEPDWLDEPRGDDVLDTVEWFPFVTFWGLTMDMANSTGVPAGHGHRYSAEYVDAWDAVLQPEDVTSADIDDIREVISRDE